MSNSATVSAVIAAELERHCDQVFSLMGNGNAWFLDAVVRRGAMRLTSVRHEAGAVAAADAYYRASGRLAVASVTYGAGFTNAITPLAEAALARVPLVALVGDQPTTGARPFDVDQVAIAAGAGVATIVAGRSNPAQDAARAVRQALSERRPVVLAVPYDIADAHAEGEGGDGDAELRPAAESAQPAEADAAQVAVFAQRLASADRPLIIAGRGAHLAGASEALRSLAGLLDARTASSALGSGIFTDDHVHLGICGGFAADRAAEAIEQADAVLVVGAGLNAFQTRFGDAFGSGAWVGQVALASAPTNARVDALLQADARLATEAIARQLMEDSETLGQSGWHEAAYGDTSGIHDERPDGDQVAIDGRLDPRSLFRALERMLPADRVIVQDGGHFIGWAPTYLSVADPERLIMVGTALQSIGLGFPSAVGAAAAKPDSTTVLVTGDGGALMALADFETVVRTVGRGIVIVCNDAAYGAEVHQYAVRGVAPEPMLIDQVDFAAIADSLGAEGVVVERLEDLARLEEWVAADTRGVLVLDCRISREVVAPYIVEVREAAIRAATRVVEAAGAR